MARRKSPPSRRERLQVLFHTRAGRGLTRLTLGALVFLLAGIVMRQARAYTYKLDDFRVHKDSVEFEGLPLWVDADLQSAFHPRMFPPLSVSIYDPSAESIVRAHVERHPLVHSVSEVRVLYPNRARVQARLRVPVAQVSVWQAAAGRKMVRRWRLLSGDGCLLPRSPYKSYLKRLPYRLPVVTGITELQPQDPGEVWEDRSGRVLEAVTAAALAERMYRDFRGRISVIRVDVSRFPATVKARAGGEVRFVLSCPPEAAGGARVERTIEWGRTERARGDVPFEDDYRTKFQRLEAILTRPRPPGYIDVRYKLRTGGSRRTQR